MSGPIRTAINRLQPRRLHVLHDLRHDFLGFTQNEVLDFREFLVAGSEQWPPAMTVLLSAAQRATISWDGILLHDHGAQQHKIRPESLYLSRSVFMSRAEFPVGGSIARPSTSPAAP